MLQVLVQVNEFVPVLEGAVDFKIEEDLTEGGGLEEGKGIQDQRTSESPTHQKSRLADVKTANPAP